MANPINHLLSARFCLILGVLLIAPFACQAQPDPPSWYFGAGGGRSMMEGAEKDTFKAGWKNFDAGIGFLPCPTWSKRFYVGVNFLFDQLDVTSQALSDAKTLNPTNIQILQASHAYGKFYSATLEPTYRAPLGTRVNGYVFGGFGWFRRSVEFTGAGGQGTLLQPGGPAVFASGGDSAAYDVGGGLEVRPARRLKFYWELRYLRGLAVNHETALLMPLSVGIRW